MDTNNILCSRYDCGLWDFLLYLLCYTFRLPLLSPLLLSLALFICFSFFLLFYCIVTPIRVRTWTRICRFLNITRCMFLAPTTTTKHFYSSSARNRLIHSSFFLSLFRLWLSRSPLSLSNHGCNCTWIGLRNEWSEHRRMVDVAYNCLIRIWPSSRRNHGHGDRRNDLFSSARDHIDHITCNGGIV